VESEDRVGSIYSTAGPGEREERLAREAALRLSDRAAVEETIPDMVESTPAAEGPVVCLAICDGIDGGREGVCEMLGVLDAGAETGTGAAATVSAWTFDAPGSALAASATAFRRVRADGRARMLP